MPTTAGVTPTGRIIEKAPGNVAAKATDGRTTHASPHPSILIRTVRDVGHAYCGWLHSHNKAPRSIDDTLRAFHTLNKHPERGDIPIERVDKAYFLRWRN